MLFSFFSFSNIWSNVQWKMPSSHWTPLSLSVIINAVSNQVELNVITRSIITWSRGTARSIKKRLYQLYHKRENPPYSSRGAGMNFLIENRILRQSAYLTDSITVVAIKFFAFFEHDLEKTLTQSLTCSVGRQSQRGAIQHRILALVLIYYKVPV